MQDIQIFLILMCFPLMFGAAFSFYFAERGDVDFMECLTEKFSLLFLPFALIALIIYISALSINEKIKEIKEKNTR